MIEQLIIRILNDEPALLSAARLMTAKSDAGEIKDMTYREIVETLMNGGFTNCSELSAEDLAPGLVDEIEMIADEPLNSRDRVLNALTYHLQSELEEDHDENNS